MTADDDPRSLLASQEQGLLLEVEEMRLLDAPAVDRVLQRKTSNPSRPLLTILLDEFLSGEVVDALLGRLMEKRQGLLDLGDEFSARRRPVQAAAHYSSALRMHTRDARAYLARGTAYAILGQYDLALPDLDRAVELAPGDAESLNRRGVLLAHVGRLREALADHDQAVALCPSGRHHLDRGVVHQLIDDEAAADADFVRAVEMLPADPRPRVARELLLFRAGRHDEACRELHVAIGLCRRRGDGPARKAAVLCRRRMLELGAVPLDLRHSVREAVGPSPIRAEPVPGPATDRTSRRRGIGPRFRRSLLATGALSSTILLALWLNAPSGRSQSGDGFEAGTRPSPARPEADPAPEAIGVLEAIEQVQREVDRRPRDVVVEPSRTDRRLEQLAPPVPGTSDHELVRRTLEESDLDPAEADSVLRLMESLNVLDEGEGDGNPRRERDEDD